MLVNQADSRDNRDASEEASGGDAQTSPTALTNPRDEVAEMADQDSIPGKAPAFQFYPNDFLSDANVIVMSLQERGAYITLMCVCWQQGTLPASVEHLARLCGCPLVAFRRIWPAVSPCFRTMANGERLMHPRLEKERKKQRAFHRRQSDNGRQGGRPRKPTESQNKPVGFSGETQPQSQTEPKKSSSVFSLPSSSSDFRQKQPLPPNARSKRPIYQSDRFVVFDWQFDDLSKMLGPHFEAFGLDEFFDALSQQSRASGLVIPKAEAWPWLQAQILTEAQRRGLPMASAEPPAVDRKARERAQDERILAEIQQDKRYAGR
jgi:uncharacterized protein YdaU (DUF1376 family)